jgi:protein SCO1/2
MKLSKSIVIAIIGVVALGIGIWLGQVVTGTVTQPPLEISGILFDEPKEIDDFILTHHTGEPMNREHFQGKWTFLYFGYTFCPDVCPMSLAELSQMQNRLSQQGLDEDNAYMLISVDPQRDTPERLGEYTAYFNEKFEAATGTPEELAKLAKQFGVIYMRPPGQEDETNYLVDHSSTVLLINPEGQLHAVFTPPHKPETMATDFAKIQARYQAVHG